LLNRQRSCEEQLAQFRQAQAQDPSHTRAPVLSPNVEPYCNIPPVGIGILQVDRARGLKLMESKLMEIFIMVCQLNMDKVSLSDLTRMRQGYIGNCTFQGYLFGYGPKYLTFLSSFSL
jgi:hypothetical protein